MLQSLDKGAGVRQARLDILECEPGVVGEEVVEARIGFRARGRLCVCVAFVLALLVAPRPVSATSSAWVQARGTGHGIRLTLSIRHHSYPQDALVRVWARMQNLTAHPLFLYDPGPQAAGKYIPQVVVLAKPGGERLPISLTDYMPFPGPAPLSILLPAHAVRNIPELVILRGALIRLDLTFATGRRLPARIGPTVSTPLLRLHLTAPDPPTVTLHVPPDQPSADITPAGSVHGALLAVWYFNCGDAYDSSRQEDIYWIAINPHIAPVCARLVGWHEVAGWLNHSVAEIDWGQL